MDYETVTTKKRVNGKNLPWRKFRKDLLPDDVFEVSIRPYGDERQEERGVIVSCYQDAIRTWSDGTSEIVKNHYARMVVPPELKGHDLCPYCGTDNGAEGEWRTHGECYGCGAA
jgi:hypothetical protein